MRNQAVEMPSFAAERLRRVFWAGGFGVLAFMTVVLYAPSVRLAWRVSPVSGLALGLWLALILAALVSEAGSFPFHSPWGLAPRAALQDMLGVVGGAWATYRLSCGLDWGAVVAAGAVGLLAARLLPRQAAAIYCGAFVGMVCPRLLESTLAVLAAGALSAVVYVLSTETLNGFGGKLGTIAFVGTVGAGLAFQRPFARAAIPAWPLTGQIVICATIAAVATYWISVRLKQGPVFGSALVGLLAGLLLPLLSADSGTTLAVVAICASFTGMSSPARIPGYRWMLLAGLVTGVVFVYSLPVLGGAGGKLGTKAFGASMGVFALRRLICRERA